MTGPALLGSVEDSRGLVEVVEVVEVAEGQPLLELEI
jgi:hypothetical protein